MNYLNLVTTFRYNLAKTSLSPNSFSSIASVLKNNAAIRRLQHSITEKRQKLEITKLVCRV